jgi:hypothetical protein
MVVVKVVMTVVEVMMMLVMVRDADGHRGHGGYL